MEFKIVFDGCLIIIELSDEEGKKLGLCRFLLGVRNSDKIR